MKCRLRKDIKEFLLFILGMSIFGVVCWTLCVIVGYIALQIFDIALYSGYVSSALSYYGMNGLGIWFLLIIGCGTLALITIPIYSAIKYFIDKGMSWKSIKDIFLECE